VLLVVLLMGCGLDELGSNPGRGNKLSIQWLPVFTAGVVMNTSLCTVPRLRKGGAVPTLTIKFYVNHTEVLNSTGTAISSV